MDWDAWRTAVEPYVLIAMWMSPMAVALLAAVVVRWLTGGPYDPWGDAVRLAVGLAGCAAAVEWLRAMLRDVPTVATSTPREEVAAARVGRQA